MTLCWLLPSRYPTWKSPMASAALKRCVSAPLGDALPDDVHAVSVSMPEWKHVELYEQGCPVLHASLRSGYPRFVYHSFVKEVNQWCWEKYVNDTSFLAFVLPTKQVANRCQSFVSHSFPSQVRIIDLNIHGAHGIVVPVEAARCYKSFWQHSGEILSSRFAKYIMETNTNPSSSNVMDHSDSHHALRKRIASMYQDISSSHDVSLYPCGMSAIFAAFRAVQKLRGNNGKVVLFGFPYLDTLKMMRRIEWSTGDVLFFPHGSDSDMDAIDQLDSIAAIFTEFPTNPLLKSADLGRLASIAHRHDTVLVVDDTIGSYNVQVLHAGVDIVCTSLTKIFTGTGTAMGGSLVVNPSSHLYDVLTECFANDSFIYEGDCIEILECSKDVHERIRKVNATASAIATRLATHSQVDLVYYPKMIDRHQYTTHLTHSDDTDSFGPLMSVVLHGGEAAAKEFYNTLAFAKGPSLGTNFTLACPYTLLAHYDELDYVEGECGVNRNLVRISVGLEDVEDIWACISTALDAASNVKN